MDQLSTVQKLFADRMFRIPDYQRGYAWEETQWRDLLEDLELLASDREHYTGTLVLNRSNGGAQPMDKEGSAYALFDVVDGQQRLTTLVLLLDAIRREMQGIERFHTLAAGIEKTYILAQDLNGQPMPKLILNKDCHSYYFNSVLEQNPSVEGAKILAHQRLADAKAYLAAYLEGKRQEQGRAYPDWLFALYHKVTQQLVLMVYTVNTQADVGVIFETMNNRGKPISELEKVKNYLLYISSKLDLQADHQLANSINSAWTHIFEHLAAAYLGQQADEDRLLRAQWLMAYDPDPKKWQGSRSIKERFGLRSYQGHHTKLLADLQTCIDSLRNAATAYCDIYRPGDSSAFSAFSADCRLRGRLAHASEKLVRLGTVASFVPLLMAARIRFPSDGEGYLALVELCEKYAFRVYSWLGKPTNTGTSALYLLAHELFTGQKDLAGAAIRLQQLTLNYCPDQRFKERFQREGENWYRWTGLKYFLYEFEEHAARSLNMPVSSQFSWSYVASRDTTIEHILPVHPKEDGPWMAAFPPDERARYTHDIGNLCLTYDNSWLSNRPFAEKKQGLPEQNTGPGYAKSIVFIERQLADYTEWTPQAVLDRRARIEAWANERWCVTPPPQPSSSEDNRAKYAPKTLEELQALADRNGVGDIFQALQDTAVKHGCGLQRHKKALVFTCPKNKLLCLYNAIIEAGTVSAWVSSTNLLRVYGMPKDQYHALFGLKESNTITRANLAEFIAKLEQMFASIEKH